VLEDVDDVVVFTCLWHSSTEGLSINITGKCRHDGPFPLNPLIQCELVLAGVFGLVNEVDVSTKKSRHSAYAHLTALPATSRSHIHSVVDFHSAWQGIQPWSPVSIFSLLCQSIALTDIVSYILNGLLRNLALHSLFVCLPRQLITLVVIAPRVNCPLKTVTLPSKHVVAMVSMPGADLLVHHVLSLHNEETHASPMLNTKG
jgi:hypothetical protein